MVLDSPQSSLGELVFLSEVLVAYTDFLCTTAESLKKTPQVLRNPSLRNSLGGCNPPSPFF